VGSYRLERKDTFMRHVVSRLYNWYLRHFHGVQLRDANWVKMIRREIFDRIEIETKGFAVDAEIVVKAQRLGCSFTEIPVSHYPRTWGNPTGVSLANLSKTARELLRIKAMVRRMQVSDDEAPGPVDDGPASG
jgi:dolichol-phosphate mannosyltransferase